MRERHPSKNTFLAAAIVASVVLGVAVALGGWLTVVGLVVFGLLVASVFAPVEAAIVLATVPYIYNVGRIEVFGLANVRILQVLWVAAVVGLLLRTAIGRPPALARIPRVILVGGAVLLAWQTVSSLASGAGARGLVEVAQTGYLLVVGMLVAMIFGTLDATRWAETASRAAVLMLLASLGGLLGYLNPVLALPYYVVKLGPGVSVTAIDVATLPGRYGIRRFSLLNLGPVGTAAVYVVVITLCLGWMLSTHRAKRGLVATTLAIAVPLVVLTLSRAAWLVAVGSGVWAAAKAGARRLVPVLAVMGVLLAIALSIPSVASRIQDIANPTEGSNRSHTRLYATAFYMANARPVFGWGPGRFNVVVGQLNVRQDLNVPLGTIDTHNFVLQEAAETGWVGAALELLLVVLILVNAARGLRGAPPEMYSLLIASCGLLLMGLTMNIFKTEVMWSVIGITLGAVLSRPVWAGSDAVAETVAPA